MKLNKKSYLCANREGLAIVAELSMSGHRLTCALEQVIEWLVKPATICCGYGPAYLSVSLVTRSV